MQKLCKFLEFGSIDPKLYWRVSCTFGKDLFEVQWRRNHPNPWRFRKVGDIFWNICKGDQLVPALDKVGVDVLALETKVRYSALQQVAFADKIVQDAKRQFGKNAVDQAISENQAFMSQLEEAVARLTLQGKTKTKKQPRLQLIKNN